MTFLVKPIVATALSFSFATAQVPIGGTIYDGMGGPLLSGTVYHTTAHLTVPGGQTLTVQPGAIVKFDGHLFTVQGTLLANGSSASPVIFTSIHDDAAGGDTNGNGSATLPGPAQWFGVVFRDEADASSLTHAIVRYTGGGYLPAVQLNSADIHATDCTFSDGRWGAMDLTNSARPSVTRCEFARCENRPAIFGALVDAVPGFVDDSVTGNPGGNYLRIDTGTLQGNVTLSANNCPGGALVYANHLYVPTGITLTLNAGVILKSDGLLVTIDGTLLANGTNLEPVIFTSLHDDLAGGDTNGNGNATVPGPSQWFGIVFRGGSDASSLLHTIVRYTGVGYLPAVQLQSADIHVDFCAFTDGDWGGMDLTNSSRPVVSHCTIERCNNRPAIFGVSLPAVEGFTDDVAQGNDGGNYLRIDTPTLAAGSLDLSVHNCPGGALVFADHLTVAAGAILTLEPGVILKASGNLIVTIDGTLVTNGTRSNPVIFTSFHDDAAGGDTNGNGTATAPAPGQWFGVVFTDAADASTLDHTIVRYTGVGYLPAISLRSANVHLSDCALSDGGWGGMDLSNDAAPTVTRCAIERCLERPAVFGVPIDSVPGFTDCTVADNAGGNFLRIDTPTVASHVAIRKANVLGGAIVFAGHMYVPNGTSLRVEAGVVLKAGGTLLVTIDGTLTIDGPVVFTSWKDDLYGGDTNGDGTSHGSPGDWFGIDLRASASGSSLEHLLVRYAGAGYVSGIRCASSGVMLRACRTEFGSYGGFTLSDVGLAEDLVAFANLEDGFRLQGGTFDVRRSTSAYNTGAGFARSGSWSGHVRSCIAYFDVRGDWSGFATGSVEYCNGSGLVGGTGNLSLDPRFVDASSGDLRLQVTSPCIDAGDPSDAPQGLDPLGFPRFLDGDLNGLQCVDMGAHEFDHLILLVSGSATPGGTLTFTTYGSASLVHAAVAFGVPPALELNIVPYGSLFVNLLGPIVIQTWPSPPSQVLVPIPLGLPTPADFLVQEVGLTATGLAGNLSNPIYSRID